MVTTFTSASPKCNITSFCVVLGSHSSSCTLPLSIHSFPSFPWTRHLCRWHSTLLLSPTRIWPRHYSPTKFSSTHLPGWLQIFELSTPLRLSSCSSDSKSNLPNYRTPHLTLSVIGVGSPGRSCSVSGPWRWSKVSPVDRSIGRSRRRQT